MNRRIPAIVGALTALVPLTARAQTLQDVTPPEVLALGVFHIESISVYGGDGTLAFNVGTHDSSTGAISSNIWTVPRSGGSITRLTTYPDETFGLALEPTYGPNFLAYRVKFEQVPPGGTVVPGPTLFVDRNSITTDDFHVRGFSWGPDGGSLVFLATTDANPVPGFYTTAGLSGTTPQRILDCAGCGTPQWSPIDNWIAYDAADGIRLVNSAGGNDHLAIPDGSGPVWSPISGQLAYVLGTNVHVTNADGSGDIQVTHNENSSTFSEISWAPDEGLIATIGRPFGHTGAGFLFVASPGGTQVTPFSTDTDAKNPQWLPITPASPDPTVSSPAPFELYYICERSTGEHICVVTGFGRASVTCDPTNWPGCCTGGVGLPGVFPGACGLGGVPCQVCDATEICEAGHCVARVPCDMAHCPNGCCDSDDVCHTANNAQFCGRGAVRCQACVNGRFCDPTGVDQCMFQACKTTCATGCCGPNGCQDGSIDDACGKGGDDCTRCSGVSHCTSDGTCQLTAASGCDITNCRDGCCLNGQCVHPPSWNDNACGSGGITCHDCVLEVGGACDRSSGNCKSVVVTCDAQSCTGNSCCTADGACEGGLLLHSCGGVGSLCQDCPVDCGPQCVCISAGTGLGGSCF